MTIDASSRFRTKLVRPRQGRVIAGVCAGFAQAYGWDPVIVRIVLCLIVLFGAGTPILAYVIAWIVMPNAPYDYPQRTDPTNS
jgi:phage shock protein PspC (stress-responsive transcriptional regulator)